MNYLLVVQQEMRNDNKLGKERQKNKQMISCPLLHFVLSLFPPFFPLRRSLVSESGQTAKDVSLQRRRQEEDVISK